MLTEGHRFATTILKMTVMMYSSGETQLPLPTPIDEATDKKTTEKYYNESLNKVQEFIAGADLFRIRNQNKMAAFMLHQAAEQTLRALLKIGTGFHANTHSIERLLRYGSLVAYRLPEIFPQDSEKEKKLFALLQKAYIDTRYKDDYTIHYSDLISLTERINELKDLLRTVAITYLQPAALTTG